MPLQVLADGKRQIMAYLVPGDFCDLHVFILKEMDHSIATLSRCSVVKIPRQRILELTERPAIARAFWWAALVDEATLREWLVNIGARPAEQRVAHLLCELLVRLRVVGLADGGRYELPLTQKELGDTTGLSNVHVNRVLRRLRGEGLITFKDKHLVILDVERLKAFSGFTPNYLHLAERNGVRNRAARARPGWTACLSGRAAPQPRSGERTGSGRARQPPPSSTRCRPKTWRPCRAGSRRWCGLPGPGPCRCREAPSRPCRGTSSHHKRGRSSGASGAPCLEAGALRISQPATPQRWLPISFIWGS